MAQSCDFNSFNPCTIGVLAANGTESIDRAQDAIKAWSAGNCMPDVADSSKDLVNFEILGASDLLERT